MVAKIAIIIKDYYETYLYVKEAELTPWSTSDIEKIRICQSNKEVIAYHVY
jgi:hypothetical protein